MELTYKASQLFLVASVISTSVIYLWWLEVSRLPMQSFNAYYIQDFNVVMTQARDIVLNIFGFFKR